MAKRILICAALLALAGCGDSPPPAPAAPKPTAAAAPKKPEPAATDKPSESGPTVEYAYSPVGKRDPFRSIIEDVNKPQEGENVRPDCGPLCKWELEQLRLVAVISGVTNPLAMVEDPNGRGYVVRRGTFVGKRNGKVTQIRSGELVVTEIYRDQMGKPHVNPVSIKLPEDKAESTEDQNLLTPEIAE
jgi:type IV pilus assembly protein PilP